MAKAADSMLNACAKAVEKFAGGEWTAPYEADAVKALMRECKLEELVHFSTKPTLLHGDLNCGNILFTEGGAVFIDFENAHFSYFPPELDLAYVMERFFLFQKRSEPEKMNQFMREYAKNGGLVDDIKSNDLLRALRLHRIIAFTRLMSLHIGCGESPAGEWRKMVNLWPQSV